MIFIPSRSTHETRLPSRHRSCHVDSRRFTSRTIPAARRPCGPGVFEPVPTLSARAILQPQYLEGLNFRVRDTVPARAGCNRYIIDSDFGVFEADGNEMLMRRVAEINAIAKLREMSQSDEFKQGLAKAASTPVTVAKNLADDPVETLASVPKGLWGMLKRTGSSVKEATSGRQRNASEGSAIENISGYTKTKRELAIKLGVDPYSTNQVFQDELAKVPACLCGKIRRQSRHVCRHRGLHRQHLRPTDRRAAREELRGTAGDELQSARETNGDWRPGGAAYLNNRAFSPTSQTILVDALARLGNIPGQSDFIRQATTSEDEHDALSFQQCALLMVKVNSYFPVARITRLGSLTVCQAQDGKVVVPIQWDYAAWTPLGDRFISALKAASFVPAPTGYVIMLTGDVSPVALQALTARGVAASVRALPGPLK